MAGVINKIRGRVTLVIVFIGLAMLAFVFTDLISNFRSFFRGDSARQNRQYVAEIAGQKVHRNYFSRRYDYQQSLMKTIGQTPQREQLADQVWNNTVQQFIVREQLQPYGLDTVRPEERIDLMIGENASPLARQMGIAQMSRQQLQRSLSALQRRMNQGKASQQLQRQFAIIRYIEDQTGRQRLQTKFRKFASAGILPSRPEARLAAQRQQLSASGKVLQVRYDAIADSTAEQQLTEQDYRDYYKEHKEQFRQDQTSAVLQYAMLPKVPTKRDSIKIKKTVNKIADEFAETDEDSAFAAGRTTTGEVYDHQYKPLKQYEDTLLKNRLPAAKDGEVIGPIRQGDQYKIYKLTDRATADTLQRVKVRHILIGYKRDTAQARRKAATLRDSLNQGVGFQELARAASEDQQTRRQGGMIGWLKPQQYGEDFYDTVQAGQQGEVIGPVRSPAGFHLVKIEDRTEEVFKAATIGYRIEPSSQTLDSLISKANNIIARVASGQSMDKATEDLPPGAVIRTVPPITGATNELPGLEGQREMDQLVSYAMTGEVGKVKQQPFNVENAYVVAQIQARFKGDYKPLELVKWRINADVIQEKKAAIITKRLKEARAQDLATTKKNYGEGARISNVKNQSFNSVYVRGVDRDAKLAGALFGAPLKSVTGPIKGTKGCYMVYVEQRNEPGEPKKSRIQQQLKQLRSQKQRQYQRRLQEAARELLKIKDWRYNASY